MEAAFPAPIATTSKSRIRVQFHEWLFMQASRSDYVGAFVKDWCIGREPSWLLDTSYGGDPWFTLEKLGASRCDLRAWRDADDEWWILARAERNRQRIPWRPSPEKIAECRRNGGNGLFNKERIDGLRRMYGDRVWDHMCDWEPQDRPGFVYYMRADNGVYKIGRTTNLGARFKAVNLVIPFELELISVLYVDDCHEWERMHHAMWAHRWVKGEWFALTPEDERYPQGWGIDTECMQKLFMPDRRFTVEIEIGG